jgi:hypothetical protein
MEFGRILAVVLDRAHARFFEVTEAGVVELPTLWSPSMRGGRYHSDRQGSPGWGEHAFHGRIREEARRHHAAIVQRLIRLDRERPADALLVGGPGTGPGAVVALLPPTLAERLLEMPAIDSATLTPAIAKHAAQRAWRAHEERLAAQPLAATGANRR